MEQRFVVVLTKREQEIIGLRYDGFRSKDIAKKLGVSESYVSQVLSIVARKIASVRDTLDVLRKVGVVKESGEIEFTEKGETFLRERMEAAISEFEGRKVSSDVKLVKADEQVANNVVAPLNYRKEIISPDNTIQDNLRQIIQRIDELDKKIDQNPLSLSSVPQIDAVSNKKQSLYVK